MSIFSLKQEVNSLLQKEISCGISDIENHFDYYPNESEAPISSTVCFEISQKKGEEPAGVAEDLCEKIDTSEYQYIKEVENIGPYLNFHPTELWFEEVLKISPENINQIESLGYENSISLEHTSVNPTGPLHIGRMRNSMIGDSLSNLLEFVGFDVTRQYYVNNAGLQVAKLVWAHMKFDEDEVPTSKYDVASYNLVSYYQKADEVLDEEKIKKCYKGENNEEDSYEQQVVDILVNLENGKEETLEKVDSIVKDSMLSSQLDTLLKFGIEFDEFTFETEFMNSEKMENLLHTLKSSEKSNKVNGSWEINLGDESLVFQRSNGTTLYPTRDILYQISKIESYDDCLLVLGEDQKSHFNKLQKCLEELGYSSEHLYPVYHSFVGSSSEGDSSDTSMSTRSGSGDFAYELIESNMKEAVESLDDDIDNKEDIAQKMLVASLRYDIISKNRNQYISFESNRATNLKSHTGVKIQYALVRLKGILKNLDKNKMGHQDINISNMKKEEKELIYKLSEFPIKLQKSTEELEPHHIAEYLKELKSQINKFYDSCPVNKCPPQKKYNRIIMVNSAKQTLEVGMNIIGIPQIDNI